MTFHPGDKVKFLNDVGGGIVTRIKQNQVFVETSDGFEIPVFDNELIKVDQTGFGNIQETKENDVLPIFSFQKKKEKNDTELVNKSPEIEIDNFSMDAVQENDSITAENCTISILLGIVPVNKKGTMETSYQIYLISDCTYRMMFTFSVVKQNFCYGYKAGLLEEDTKLLVAQYSINELKEIQSFKTSFIFYKKGIFLPHEPIIFEYKINDQLISNAASRKENDYFDENAIIINISEESLLNEIERNVSESEEAFIIQKKQKDVIIKKSIIQNSKDTEEIDLHIENLVHSIEGLSSGEILDIQMSRFLISLEGAIRNKTKKIVFIHGVGNGKLKYEIRKQLDSSKYSRYRYQDASFKEYGYGATMVMLK